MMVGLVGSAGTASAPATSARCRSALCALSLVAFLVVGCAGQDMIRSGFDSLDLMEYPER
jgi:hypothetical protein